MELRLFFFLVILSLVNEGDSGQSRSFVPSSVCCTEPRYPGPCRASIPRYFFNVSSKMCEEFKYGGCKGNANNYVTNDTCIRACLCSLPSEPGPCEAYFPMYFFNKTSKACEGFIYGGCGGNANKFVTLQDCQQVCLPYCDLPSDTGPCKAGFKRYFYNTKAKACRLFTYGGCGGNANNFLTLADCQRACHP